MASGDALVSFRPNIQPSSEEPYVPSGFRLRLAHACWWLADAFLDLGYRLAMRESFEQYQATFK